MKIIELLTSNFSRSFIRNIIQKNTCLIGVFSESCPHCVNMKPEWKLLKNKLKNKKMGGYLIEIKSDLLSDINLPALSSAVKGLPSILIFKNGKFKKEFADERTHLKMFKFIRPYTKQTLKKNPTLKNSIKKNSKKNRPKKK